MTASFFNYSWTIILIVFTIVSCGQVANNNSDSSKVSTATVEPVDTSLIAIIPFDNSEDGPFDNTYLPSTLTQDDIEKIEVLMTACINKYNNNLSSDSKQYFTIELAKEKYKRQYVAVTNKKGEKEVWINCLCRAYSNNWKTSIILVNDGGNCYFSLKINLTKEKCYELYVNGHA